MKAVIISSGDGTRLRPITCSIPHSMLPIIGKPVIGHTVKNLIRHNIKNISISSSYLQKEIKKYFSAITQEKYNIEFSEIQDFGTLSKDDDTLLISDSILSDIDFDELISVHTHSGSDITVIAKHGDDSYRYGVMYPGKEGFATSYSRCRDFGQLSGIPFMGIAVIKKGTQISNCKDFQSFLEKATPDNTVYCHTPDCYIRDISDFESYNRCCRDFMDKKIRLPFPCAEKAPSVWVDENATVMQGAVIMPPVYIGPGSVINKGARVDSYTQIGSDVTVDCYASIKRSIIMDNSCICENASLRGTIIGRNCHIGYESAAYEGSVIGFGSKTGRHCTLRTAVHIWPDKFIEDESNISENIIWEDTSRPFYLRESGAEGILNREITAEFALQLARSTVSLFGKKIAVSCEGGSVGTMIKNALIAGIQSGGGKAYDLGEQPLPITRSAVRFYSLDGGISLSVYSANSTLYGALDIINPDGTTPDKETLLSLNRIMEDCSAHKASAHLIQEPEYLFEYKLYYLKQLINSTSKKSLGAKILIYTPSSWAKELLKSAASDLNCDFEFSSKSDITEFSKEVTDGEYHFGAFCDAKCETLTLVTDSGKILSEYDYCVLTALIIMKQFKNSAIYVPESAPDIIEKLAEKYRCVVHRTQVSPPYLMRELSKNSHRQFLHQFIYRFDAVGAIIILLDFLYTNGFTLDGLAMEIPPHEVVTSTVPCPGGKQKDVMEKFYHNNTAQIPQTTDAVKLNFKNGWVLIVPEKEASYIRVISHALTTEYAQEIADICIDKISE